MPPAQLRFETTATAPYPVTTTGAGTALTVCKRFGDPFLAFVTQVPYDDEVVFLSLGEMIESSRLSTPPGRHVITGIGYAPQTRLIWCSSGTNADADVIFAFDPDTGAETTSFPAPRPVGMSRPNGLGTNGFLIARGGGEKLQIRTMGGIALGTRTYAGRIVSGVTASPFSWAFSDKANDQIVVIGPLGNIIAVAGAPGAAFGIDALAFDYVTNAESQPQVWLPGGIIGDPGTIHHPDTPWSPAPWGGRHRLFVANATDQTLYQGYLTAQP